MTAQNKHGQIKRDENLMIASKILGRNSSYPNLLQLETSEQNNINNNQPSDIHKEHKDHIFNPT